MSKQTATMILNRAIEEFNANRPSQALDIIRTLEEKFAPSTAEKYRRIYRQYVLKHRLEKLAERERQEKEERQERPPKHRPSPWYYVPTDPRYPQDNNWNVMPCRQPVEGSRMPVAQKVSGRDVALITSAPELLAAAKYAARFLESLGTNTSYGVATTLRKAIWMAEEEVKP